MLGALGSAPPRVRTSPSGAGHRMFTVAESPSTFASGARRSHTSIAVIVTTSPSARGGAARNVRPPPSGGVSPSPVELQTMDQPGGRGSSILSRSVRPLSAQSSSTVPPSERAFAACGARMRGQAMCAARGQVRQCCWTNTGSSKNERAQSSCGCCDHGAMGNAQASAAAVA